ncbi:MAG: aldehyde dehydrogenase family protein, partial [Cyclobacteriaceae bacterium]
MEITGKNFIGFERSSNGKNSFNAVNPDTLKPLETDFYEATSDEINKAVEKAERAFQQYKSMTNSDRAGFLEMIGEEIMALSDELIHRCMQETGLPEGRL